MSLPPSIVLFGAVVIALAMSGAVRSCQEIPEIDNGVEVMKGGVEQ